MSKNSHYRLCPGCGKKGLRWEAHQLVCMYCRQVSHEGR
jgi:hypothetical protein